MISFLIGKIHKITPLTVDLNVNGVGYRVHTTLTTTETLNLHDKNENIILYTRIHYTETSQTLYGFLNEHEVTLFDFLISLHGIGPKIVMSILSYCNIGDFLTSLKNGDSEILTKVPGIGKTKAEKILFEAKSKEKKLENIIFQYSSGEPGHVKENFVTGKMPDLDVINSILIDSLETLGFNKKEIALAEKKIQIHETDLPKLDKDNIQLWIRTYLKYL